MPRLVRTLLGASFLVLLFLPAQAQTLAGHVVGVAGQCFVDRGSQRFQFRLGAAVDVGDVVEVPADGKLKLRMNDGSILSVAPNSKMTITTYTLDAQGKRQDVALSLGQGLLRAVVAPVDKPTTFEVKTATGTAAVRSTDWFIEVNSAGTGIAVLRGSVGFQSNATGVQVLVPAGYSSSITAGKDPTPPAVMTAAAFEALIERVEIVVARPHRPARGGGGYYYRGPEYPGGGELPPAYEGPPPSYEGPPAYAPPPPPYVPPNAYQQPPGFNGPPAGGVYSTPPGVFGTGPNWWGPGPGFGDRPRYENPRGFRPGADGPGGFNGNGRIGSPGVPGAR